jgi:hypothetical protein
MCPVLPANPNLEHLKSQAKELLARLQQEDPTAQLADAQHALARGYGFASWPKMKAHIEALAPSSRAALDSPLSGVWVVNVSRSKQSPANPFQSARIEVVVTADAVTFDQLVVEASGKTQQGKQTLRVDGNAHPIGASGYAIRARWLGANVLETLATKDGQPAGAGRYEVSDDGATMIVTDEARDQRLVLERVSGAESLRA